jgi:hypothetical protein
MRYSPDGPMMTIEFGPKENWARTDWPTHPLLTVDRDRHGNVLTIILIGSFVRRAHAAGPAAALRELCLRESAGVRISEGADWTLEDVGRHLTEFGEWVDANEDLLASAQREG